MDTMAFVEDFLKSQDIDYTPNQEERTFEFNYQGDLVNIPLVVYCPEVNEENGILFDEIISYAFLACNVPEEKASEVVAYLNQVNVEVGPTFSKIFLRENQIIACGHFFVWDEMTDDQLDTMLLSPARFLLEYEKAFLRLLVDDSEKKEESNVRQSPCAEMTVKDRMEESEKIVSTALASAWPRLGTYVPLSTPLKDIWSADYIPTKDIVDYLSCDCDLFLDDDEIDDDEIDYSNVEDLEIDDKTIADVINCIVEMWENHAKANGIDIDTELYPPSYYQNIVTDIVLNDTGYYTWTSSICFTKVRKVRNKFINFIKDKFNLSLSTKDVDEARSIAELIELVDAAIKGKKLNSGINGNPQKE